MAVQAYDDGSDPKTNGVKASLSDIIAYDLKRAAGNTVSAGFRSSIPKAHIE